MDTGLNPDVDNPPGNEKACSSSVGTAPTEVFDNRIMHVVVPTPHDTFTEEEVAAKLGVEAKTVRNLALRSRDLAFIPVGKRRIYLRKDVEAFLESRRVATVRELSEAAPNRRSSS